MKDEKGELNFNRGWTRMDADERGWAEGQVPYHAPRRRGVLVFLRVADARSGRARGSRRIKGNVS